MKSSQFKEFLSQLNLLTFNQKARVGEVLRHAQPADGLLGNLGVANACRHCQSKEFQDFRLSHNFIHSSNPIHIFKDIWSNMGQY